MSTMNEERGIKLGPEGARVAVLRRHGGYAVVAVIDEGPFSHEEAHQRAEALNRRPGMLSRAEAACQLGISVKGVDFLVTEGRLAKVKDGHRAFIPESSVQAELSRRNG